MNISRFIHVAANGIITFFFMAEWYSIVYIYHTYFIHSSVNGHLGCFHVLVILNTAAMNIGVHVSFWIWVFFGYVIWNLLRSQPESADWSHGMPWLLIKQLMNMEASLCRRRDFLVLKSQNGVTTSTFAWGTWLYKADSIKEGVEVTFSGQMTPTGKKIWAEHPRAFLPKFPTREFTPPSQGKRDRDWLVVGC